MPTTSKRRPPALTAVTVRQLPVAAVDRLKRLAKSHHHSLEAEIRAILIRQAERMPMEDWLVEAEQLRQQTLPWKSGMPTAADLVRMGRDEGQ